MTLSAADPYDWGMDDRSVLPAPDPSPYRIHLLDTVIVGICFRGDPFELTAGLKEGDVLRLVREPENGYDAHAIKIVDRDGLHIGYVPRGRNEVVSNLMDAGKHVICEITWIEEYFDGPEVGIGIWMDNCRSSDPECDVHAAGDAGAFVLGCLGDGSPDYGYRDAVYSAPALGDEIEDGLI